MKDRYSSDLLGCEEAGVAIVLFDAREGMEVEYHRVATGESLFILSGTHEVILENGRETLTAGDLVYFPPGSEHGMRCLEAGRYLAVFAPSKSAMGK